MNLGRLVSPKSAGEAARLEPEGGVDVAAGVLRQSGGRIPLKAEFLLPWENLLLFLNAFN